MISEAEHDLAVRTMLSKWRTDAGLTQEQIGKLLGISRRSVQMIESGECRVKSYTIIQWAALTGGHDPVLFMQHILHPRKSLNNSTAEEKRAMLYSLMATCTDDDLDALIEIFMVEHGGTRMALLHLMAAYVQLDPGDKQNIVLLVLNCFRNMTRKRKPRFAPDLDLISAVREKAVDAHIHGHDHY